MVSRVVTVPGDFFEDDLGTLDLAEVQVYLYIAYELRWSLGKPLWTLLDPNRLWMKFGLADFELEPILRTLATRHLIEFHFKEGKFYARLKLTSRTD